MITGTSHESLVSSLRVKKCHRLDFILFTLKYANSITADFHPKVLREFRRELTCLTNAFCRLCPSQELCLILGDGPDQAALVLAGSFLATPSVNVMPSMTRGN